MYLPIPGCIFSHAYAYAYAHFLGPHHRPRLRLRFRLFCLLRLASSVGQIAQLRILR